MLPAPLLRCDVSPPHRQRPLLGARRPAATLARPLVANVGENGDQTTREAGEAVIAAGLADLVSYGRSFISNPDLPERFAVGAPLSLASGFAGP
jgi:N-ethylmaleimide reductase